MAKMWTTGPALLYAGIAGGKNSKQIRFVGTGETAPDIELKRAYSPAKNDLAGTIIPMDEVYEGQEALITVTVNRYNLSTILAMQAASEANFGGTPGYDTAGAIGSLMAQEGNTFPFYVVFPYATRPTMAGMMAGYRFWSGKLVGPDTVKPGTKEKQILLMVKCMRAYTASPSPLSGPALGGTPGLGAGFNSVGKLYDFDVAGVPAID